MTEAVVIIPHYNDAMRLRRCLEVLMLQVAAANTPQKRVDVVVVDNGSTDPLDDIPVAWPELRLLSEQEKGAAAARNRGVIETDADALFFLDADCIPQHDWLKTALSLNHQADVIGGTVTVFDETPAPRSGAEAFETVFAFDNRSYVEKKGFSVTANLLTRREVFLDVGGFAPMRSEDLDWCQRADAKGYRLIHAKQLCVTHPTRADWHALRNKWRRITQESFGMVDRNVGAYTKWALRGLAMPFSIVPHGLRLLLSPRLSGMQERLVGLATLTRLRLTRCIWMLRQALGQDI